MDADEALARRLQEEELRAVHAVQSQLQLQGQPSGARAAGAGGGGGGYGTVAFQNRLQIIMETALRCEDAALQQRARGLMPLARLRAAAAEGSALAARLGPDALAAAPAREDLLAAGLLVWFKTQFFTWVDTLPCDRCGSSASQHAGPAVPGPDDLAGGASRVELHRCSACGHTMRFPRYNSAARLLQPGCRRGRCGEWANVFLLCCRAAGLTARYVSDWTDHVWTEYYSHSMRRWVHLDSCEASYDQPLLYEGGWGKEVSYVVAAGVWGASDVTARYTAKPRHEVGARRGLIPEGWLAAVLDAMTAARRAGWGAPRRLVWLGRDAEERVELLRQRLGLRRRADAAPLPGRQTGSLEWRQQRGETGSTPDPTPARHGPVRPATPYRLAAEVAGGAQTGAAPGASASPHQQQHQQPQQQQQQQPLPAVFRAAGWLCGGAVRACGQNDPSEGAERLFDGRASTKWLDFGAGGPGGSSWVEYRLPSDLQAVAVVGYELVSANDSPERDPAAWRLEGVSQEDYAAGRLEQWAPLDERSGVRFPARHAPLSFHLPRGPSPPLRRLRLCIAATADPRAANSVQLACWNIFRQLPGDVAPDGAGGGGGGGGTGGPLQRLREAVAAGGVDAAAAALLGRLLGNIRREPRELRFRRVRCSKAQALLQCGPLAAVLLSYCRFRPLLMAAPPEAGAGGGGEVEDVFLQLAADAEGEDLRRVSSVLEVLEAAR